MNKDLDLFNFCRLDQACCIVWEQTGRAKVSILLKSSIII